MRDTIDMAREAGIKYDLDGVWCDVDQLKAFEALVRADQREIDAEIADLAEPYQAADLIRARGNT
jgi:hypothetical protein